jgi:Fe-S-cluster containining protein
MITTILEKDSLQISPVNNLSYSEALQAPCRTCNAVCCYYLPLQSVNIHNLMELERIRYYLCFPNIVAGVSIGGQWSIYYTVPCRHLDLETRHCTIHDTPEHPKTCSAYNEHDCWYQRALRQSPSGFIQFSSASFDQAVKQMQFDEERNISSVPSWSEMIQICSNNPVASDPNESLIIAQNQLLKTINPNGHHTKSLAEMKTNPCQGCEAPCCRSLFFSHPVPGSYMQLDYVRFTLNFPGVEYMINPTTWWLVITATCKHFNLESRQCELFGKPERPLACVHLNQWDCGQYKQIISKQTEMFRLTHDNFDCWVENYKFDEFGYITQ